MAFITKKLPLLAIILICFLTNCYSIPDGIKHINQNDEIQQTQEAKTLYNLIEFVQNNSKYFSLEEFDNLNMTVVKYTINRSNISSSLLEYHNSLLIKNQELRIDYQQVLPLMLDVKKKRADLLSSIPINQETGKRDKNYYLEHKVKHIPWYHLGKHIKNLFTGELSTLSELERLWEENQELLQTLEWWNSFLVHVETHRQYNVTMPNSFSLLTISDIMKNDFHRDIHTLYSMYHKKKEIISTSIQEVFTNLEDSILTQCIHYAKESPSHIFELYEDVNTDILQNILCRFQDNGFCEDFTEKRKKFFHSIYQEYKPLLLVPDACAELASEKVEEITLLYEVLLSSIYNISYGKESVALELDILHKQQQQLALSTLFLSSLKETVPLLSSTNKTTKASPDNQTTKKELFHTKETTANDLIVYKNDGHFVKSDFHQQSLGPERQYMMYDDGDSIYRATVERVEKKAYYETLYPLFAITKKTQLIEPLWTPVLQSIQHKLESKVVETNELIQSTKWVQDMNSLHGNILSKKSVFSIYEKLQVESPLIEITVLDLLLRQIAFVHDNSTETYDPILTILKNSRKEWIEFLNTQTVIQETEHLLSTYVSSLSPIMNTLKKSLVSLYIEDQSNFNRNQCYRRLLSTILVNLSTEPYSNFTLTSKQLQFIHERSHIYQLMSKDVMIRNQFIIESLLREGAFELSLEQIYIVIRFLIDDDMTYTLRQMKSPSIWNNCIHTVSIVPWSYISSRETSVQSFILDIQNVMISNYESNSDSIKEHLDIYLNNPYIRLLEDSHFT